MDLTDTELAKILALKDANAAYVYLHLRAGYKLPQIRSMAGLLPEDFDLAVVKLRQNGMLPGLSAGEKPQYGEASVVAAMADANIPFPTIVNRAEQILGRVLNSEDLKVLLAIVNYLGFDLEMVVALLEYCTQSVRKDGYRGPNMRYVEKIAYQWSEQGFSSAEEIRAYLARKAYRASRIGQIQEILQIRGRDLTSLEEKCFNEWIEAGYENQEITSAYEITLANIGKPNLRYMSAVLAGSRTEGQNCVSGKGGSYGSMGAAELEAIAAALQTKLD